MANTYTQLYIHIVFAVQGRYNLIPVSHKEELQKYITGIVSGKNQKLISINCMPNHAHILIGLQPDCALSAIVRDIKANSSKFMNEQKWFRGRFEWQKGFGAFTLGHSQLDVIIKYIANQETHHKQRPFRDEYVEFLKRYEVAYDLKYIFKD
jgi:REP element-mobilizing transposase RayT